MLFSYLDAATGGMVVQTIVAGAVAIPFIFRTQITRAINRLRGRKPAVESEGEPDAH